MQIIAPAHIDRQHHVRGGEFGRSVCVVLLLMVPVFWVLLATGFGWFETMCSNLSLSYPVLVRCWLFGLIGTCAVAAVAIAMLARRVVR